MLACFLHGGTLPHVGGQALASPDPLLHGARLSRADLWVATVPGHKDAEVAAAVARRDFYYHNPLPGAHYLKVNLD